MSRPAIAAQALGIAEGAFEAMVKYATERKTFGQFIAEHQMIQAILADSGMLIEACRGLVYRAAALYDDGKRNTKIASMAKCFASDAAMKITTDAVQVLGAMDTRRIFRWNGCQRCEADPNFRGNESDPANRHRSGDPKRGRFRHLRISRRWHCVEAR